MSLKFKTREVTFRKVNEILTNLHVDFFLMGQENRNRGKKLQLSTAEESGKSVTKMECDEFELYICIKEKEVCHG